MEKYIIIGVIAWLYFLGAMFVKQVLDDDAMCIHTKGNRTKDNHAKWRLISAILWPILLILCPFLSFFHETMNNTIFWLWWGLRSIVAEKMNN